MSGSGFDDVRRFTTIDSTNRYLLDEARRGAPEGVVAVADHQSQGRGRLGRRWEAPPHSGLLASVLLRPVVGPARLWLCTAAVALATADACAQVAGVTPELKWPNDLVVDDLKLAGVLAESDPGAPGGPPGSVAVVVGVGCNITWPGPSGAGGTSLEAAARRAREGAPSGDVLDGDPVTIRDVLLHDLLDGLARRRPALDEAGGGTELVDEARSRCSTIGRRVRATLAERELVGTARAITDEGHLVVDGDDGGVEMISAGDVTHLRTEDGVSSAANPASSSDQGFRGGPSGAK